MFQSNFNYANVNTIKMTDLLMKTLSLKQTFS